MSPSWVRSRIHVEVGEAEVLMLLVQHPMKRPSLAFLCLANLRFFPDQVAIAWHGSEKTQKIYKNDPDNDHKKMSIWKIWWEPHRYRHKKGINTWFSHKTLGKKQGNKHVWWWSGITCFFCKLEEIPPHFRWFLGRIPTGDNPHVTASWWHRPFLTAALSHEPPGMIHRSRQWIGGKNCGHKLSQISPYEN